MNLNQNDVSRINALMLTFECQLNICFTALGCILDDWNEKVMDISREKNLYRNCTEYYWGRKGLVHINTFSGLMDQSLIRSRSTSTQSTLILISIEFELRIFVILQKSQNMVYSDSQFEVCTLEAKSTAKVSVLWNGVCPCLIKSR